MTRPETVRRLRWHLRQHTAARLIQCLALAAGLVGAIWHGLPSVALGGLVALALGWARPGPDPRIDRDLGPPE